MSRDQRPRHAVLWGLLLLLFLSSVFVLSLLSLFGGGGDGDGAKLISRSFSSGDTLGLVRIEGVIIDGTDVVRQLDEWAEDESTPGVLIRIVSPGGVVAPSQEIYDAVKRLAEKKKVVCSFGHVAASGGYYIGAACEKIVAAPGGITGSIGVIMMFNTLYELWDKIGVGSVVIKSGAFKDTGSPDRPFTDEDRALMQGMVDDIYRQFLEAVAAGRKITVEKARELSAGGRIYSGAQALEVGLVDEMGDQRRAVKILAEMVGYEGEPDLVEKTKQEGLFERLMEEKFEVLTPARFSLPAGAYFLWEPGV
ncbi:MAG: signal peptide peptidase SppA [Nitrospinae bacterium]|nr:signal peptide peptidase SppA [Nitrospinota bacterium]